MLMDLERMDYGQRVLERSKCRKVSRDQFYGGIKGEAREEGALRKLRQKIKGENRPCG